jgi:hypothetical protein
MVFVSNSLKQKLKISKPIIIKYNGVKTLYLYLGYLHIQISGRYHPKISIQDIAGLPTNELLQFAVAVLFDRFDYLSDELCILNKCQSEDVDYVGDLQDKSSRTKAQQELQLLDPLLDFYHQNKIEG